MTLPLALALVATACTNNSTDFGGEPAGDDLILRMAYEGGFVPYEFHLQNLPTFALYADGRVIVQGAQIEIYPPPAIPPLVARTLTQAGIDQIIAAAEDAGLDGADASYGYDLVADASTTVFTYLDSTGTHRIEAYALGMDASGPGPGNDPADAEARRRLNNLQTKLGDLGSWIDESDLGAESPYDTDEMRLFAALASTRPVDPQTAQAAKTWPLDTPIGDFATYDETYSCATFSGADLETLLPELRESTTLTPWASAGSEYLLVVRPLLPDESACPRLEESAAETEKAQST